MEELIERAKSGDEKAFEELVKIYRTDLERMAKSRLVDKDSVDDVLQNVYIKVFKKLNTLQDNSKFKSWLFMILRNECINANNHLSNHEAINIDDLEETLEDVNSYNPDSEIAFEERISNLTEEEKNLLRMKYAKNYTNTEIADELGIPYNTVKSKIFRAIKRTLMLILILVMISGFTVLAAFVIKKIKAHFTTSLTAIDAAVENDYVQEIDSDFAYDNGIGIKVDAIVLDDKNLAISFVYDIQDKEKYKDITGIGIKEYVIKADHIIIVDIKNKQERFIDVINQDFQNYEEYVNFYRNSVLLFGMNGFPKFKTLYIEINKIVLSDIKTETYIFGSWVLTLDVNDKLNERETIVYFAEENIFVKNAKGVLKDTSIQFDIDLNMKVDYLHLNDSTLYSTNRSFEFIDSKINRINNYFRITFDLGKYTDDVNDLILVIPLENKEKIELKFKRDS